MKSNKIKQYGIWLLLLAKRLWRQPVYIGLFVLIPVLGYALSVMEHGEISGAVTAVCVEEGAWSAQITDRLRRQAEDSVIAFEFCDNASGAERLVMSGRADCGFVVAPDIKEKVLAGEWRKCITVYETPGSSITGMAKERISSVIFQLYSEQCYGDYMGQISEEAVNFALEAYETHLADGSTFGFRYENDDQYGQYNSDINDTYDTTVFPIEGVLAVVIFISGMCGMLEYDRDKREKRFLRMAPNILTYIVNIWIPTVFVSAAVLICLWLSDGMHHSGGQFSLYVMVSVWDAGMWLIRIGQLIVYQCVVILYCCILGTILRRQETIAVSIPILSLGSLVCAPVFIRLSAYLPVFAVLEKLFPVTYYLMWR